MGSLENARILARTVGETVTKVQGPMDVRPMTDALIRPCFVNLHKQGPVDQWWQSIVILYDDCIKNIPQNCRTLAEYAQWAEHMVRFWHTVLSAREIIVAWAGADPTKNQCAISPTDLLTTRDIALTDFPKGNDPTEIEKIGNETLGAMKSRGIHCFDPWTSAQYRGYFLRNHRKTAKVICHKDGSTFACGFYAWTRRKPLHPSQAFPAERAIGKETLRTRTLWPEEISPERVGFRSFSLRNPSVTAEEGAIRIALDLIKASIDTKLPLVLPEAKKAQP